MIARVVLEVVEPIKQDVSQLKSDMTEQKQAISQLQDDMAEQKQAVAKLQTNVSEIHLILENDVRKRIDIIAEGHLDLSRKLDDALRIENEKEMTILRVTKLENEVRGMKARNGVRV